MGGVDGSIERGVQRVVGAFTLYYLVNAALLFGPRVGEAGPRSILLATATGLLFVVLAVRGWRGQLSRIDIVVALALLLATLGLNHLWHTAGVGDAGGPAYGGVSTALFIEVVVLSVRGFFVVGSATVLGYAVGRALGLGSLGFWDGLDEGISHLGFMSAFAISLLVLRRADVDADAALAQELRADSERIAAESATRALRESERILHDDVIAALVSVKLSADTTQPERVQSAARRAIEAFDEATRPTSMPTLTPEDLANPLSIRVDYDIEDSIGVWDALPTHVSGALALATMEALRNVERHAGVGAARISRTTRVDGSTTVVVHDEGRGFDPTRVSSARHFGIAHGIIERMRDIGGHARIDSAPGTGTTVTLWWAAPPESTPPALLRSLASRLQRRVPQVALACLVGQAWLALRHSWSAPDPWPLLATGAASAAITGLLALVVRHFALVTTATVAAVTATVAQLALLGLNLSLVGPQAIPSFDSWIVEFVEVTLIVIGLAFTPALPLIGGAATAAILTATAWLSPEVTVAASGATIIEPLLVTGGAVAIAASVRRAQRAIAERRRTALESGRVAGMTHGTNLALAERLAGLRDSILPFLDDIVAGRRSVVDPHTQEHARLLESEARDELYLHGLLDEELRALLRSARERGCKITIRSTEDATGGTHASRVLRLALEPERTRRAVLVLPRPGSPEIRLRMSPPLTTERIDLLAAELADLHPRIESDAESTTIAITVDR